MDISIEKLNLIQKILLIKDENFIESVSKFIEKKISKSEEVDGWDELPAHVKDSIKTSQQQMEAGQSIPLEEVLEKYRKKYEK